MKYYAVHTDYTDPFQPMHIQDKRKLSRIGKDILEAGFLSSEAVDIQQASASYNDGSQTVTQHFFSVAAKGQILFMEEHIRHINEVIVPDGAHPMPEE